MSSDLCVNGPRPKYTLIAIPAPCNYYYFYYEDQVSWPAATCLANLQAAGNYSADSVFCHGAT